MAYFDPENESQVSGLRMAVERSYRHLETFRAQRFTLLRYFIGSKYSKEGIGFGRENRVLVNTISMSHDVMLRSLITKLPRVMIQSRNRALKAKAARFEAALNRRLVLLGAQEPIVEATSDAMFCMGIVRTGVGRGNYTLDVDGTTIDPGEVYLKSVDFDDFVVDCRARKIPEACLIGNWFVLPKEQAMDGGLYKQDVVELSVIDGGMRTEYDAGNRAEEISGQKPRGADEYSPHVRMLDVYLPQERLIVTLGNKGNKVASWVQLDPGEPEPYTALGFGRVPNNLIPKAPLSDLIDLHGSLNVIAIKTAQKCERQKTVTGVRGGSSDDAKRVIEAEDGQMIRLDNPDAVREFNYGGPDGPTAAMMLTLRDWYSWASWNLDTLGGLSSQADTLGQEKILSDQANGKVKDMQDRVVQFVRDIVRKIGWYDWHDPLLDVPIERKLGKFSVESNWTPEERDGEYEYEIDIHPYSLREESPASKFESLVQFYERLIGPNMPYMAQQGIAVDFEELMRLFAKYGDNLDVEDILGLATGSMIEGARGGGGEGPGMAANTTRTNVRVNKPGATRQGKDQMMANLLFGGKNQGSEMATAGRSVG